MPWQLQCAFHLFAVIASTGGPADHSMPLAHGGKGFARCCPLAAPSGSEGRETRRRQAPRSSLTRPVDTHPRTKMSRAHSPRASLCLRGLPAPAACPTPGDCSSLRGRLVGASGAQRDWTWRRSFRKAGGFTLDGRGRVIGRCHGHGHGHGHGHVMGRRGAYVSLLQGSCQGQL